MTLAAIDTDLNRIAEMLEQSSDVLVISGAGMSTASGIADYRDDTGALEASPAGSASSICSTLALAAALLGAKSARLSSVCSGAT